MKCDVCEFEMTTEIDGTDCTIIGVQHEFHGNHPMTDRVKKLFGKTRFLICHVCWLKSLGVKPLEQKND